MLLPGYNLNEEPIYSDDETILFSGSENGSNKSIVIKLLKSEHPSSEEIEKFKHEYEITKKLACTKNTVHTYGLEKYQHSYAIVLENIFAPSLAEILAEEKKFKLLEFLQIAILITEALDEVHQLNIIHKDINPGNILYNRAKKEITLIDFGLAITLPKEKAAIVSPNILEGTLAYLSPEQTGRMNRGLDYRTDYYSLGDEKDKNIGSTK